MLIHCYITYQISVESVQLFFKLFHIISSIKIQSTSQTYVISSPRDHVHLHKANKTTNPCNISKGEKKKQNIEAGEMVMNTGCSSKGPGSVLGTHGAYDLS